MIQITMQVPDELGKLCQAAGRWLPTLVELSFVGFKTSASSTVAEVTEFLAKNPTHEELLNFYISESSQLRLRRLLALNEAGCLSESERLEMDELQQLEHIVVMLKTEVAAQSQDKRRNN